MNAIALEAGCAEDKISNVRDVGGYRFFTDDLGRSWSVKVGESGIALKNTLRRDFVSQELRLMSSQPLKDPELEALAAQAAKVLKADGKAMASQYIFGALENMGLYDLKNPAKSKLKPWEVHAIADRSLKLSEAL